MCFAFVVIMLFGNSEKRLIAKQQKVITERVYQVKKEQIADIVNSVQITLETAIQSSYLLYENLLNTRLIQLNQKLAKLPEQQWCGTLASYLVHEKIEFKLNNAQGVACLTSGFDSSETTIQPFKAITASKQLNDDLVLTIKYQQKTVIAFVKTRVAHLIRNLRFENSDIYVWVNEVINFDGGDNYAKRIVHPNLPETEGQFLSTNTQDIKGNLPYLEELNGIKAHGNIYFSYYFKKKTTNIIKKKLAYAQLYQPFNWIIATGIYTDDIDAFVNHEIQIIADEHTQQNYILIVITMLLSCLLIFLLFKFEQRAISFKEKQLNLEHKELELKNYKQVLSSMLELVERRDSYTAGHTKRVARYASMIAKKMGFSKEDIAILYEAAIMHDIGKISTPDTILLKPGKLTKQEYKIIQNHLESGYAMLSSIEALKPHAEIMRNHHERYDGKGYPRGLKGDEMSIMSHILILVDAFDAMTSKRIYRNNKTKEDALAEISSLSGSQFCPEVVKVAIPLLSRIKKVAHEHDYLSNEYEQARLAYYYKDSLTGLFNYRYFEHILSFNHELYGLQYKCCYLVSLVNFHQLNKQQGWLAGDKELASIGATLTRYFPDAIIFRVFGDDFLVLSEKHIDVEKSELTQLLELDDKIIDIALYHFNIDQFKMNNFEELGHIMDKLIDESKNQNADAELIKS